MFDNFATSDKISAIALLVSAFSALWAYFSFRKAQEANKRALIMQGETFLLEANKMIMADPLLLAIFDDAPIRKEHPEETAGTVFQVKLEAFADVLLNMFDVMLSELPNPSKAVAELQRLGAKAHSRSDIWIRFFLDTVAGSSLVRERIEGKGPIRKGGTYQPALLGLYREWQEISSRKKDRPVMAGREFTPAQPATRASSGSSTGWRTLH